MFRSFNWIQKTVVLSVLALGGSLAAAQSSEGGQRVAGQSTQGGQRVAGQSTVEVENKSYYLCKNQKEVRTIRVQVEDGMCRTFYSKAGAEKNVGSGQNHESCVNFLNNIKTNLEKSNWNCRDISATRITASVE